MTLTKVWKRIYEISSGYQSHFKNPLKAGIGTKVYYAYVPSTVRGKGLENSKTY